MSSDNGVDISSPRNRWIKLARSLHRRRSRYRERAILVEGIRPVAECIAAESAIRVVLVSEDQQGAIGFHEALSAARAANVTVLTVDPGVFALACDTETPQGILAICEMPDESQIPPRRISSNPLLLVLDQVRDPGNLGTLLRSAQGAGADAVLISRESADPYSPKVIRAGAGSHFRLQIKTLDWYDPSADLGDCAIYVADADGDLDYVNVDWTQPAAIVIGNETTGASSAAFSRAHGRVGIPLANSLESLNAGVAGSVILFEAWRQRRTA